MIRAGCLALAVAMAAAAPMAASADDLVRGLVGIGAAALLNGMQQQNAAPQQRPIGRVPGPVYRTSPAGVRESPRLRTSAGRRDVQVRLNALGYDVGEPDGAFGRRTRNAIALFQSSIGHRPSGVMTEGELLLLVQRTGGWEASPQGFAALGPAAGGHSPGTFPKLGAAPGGAGGGFPKLGGPQGQAGSAFPPLGGPAAGRGASAGGTAFPKLGAASPTAAPGTSFPGLGKAPQDPSGASPFPKIGSAPQASEPQPGFPALGAAPTEKAASFPGVAQPKAADRAAPAMPELAEAPSVTDPPMPKLSKPSQPPAPAMPPLAKPGKELSGGSGEPEASTLAAEAARTPFREVDALPAVLGIRLGDAKEGVVGRLEKAGFSGCTTASSTIACMRKTASLIDTLTVHLDRGRTWAILRTLSFTPAMDADAVLAPFKAAFPKLMAAASNRISSRDACGRDVVSDPDLASIVRGVAALTPGAPVPVAFSDVARSCPLVLSVSFDGTDMLAGARLAFVDLTAVSRQAAAASARAAAEEKARRARFSDDLKL
ncbi:MAG: peptidoglycan-binding protein [Pararhizobium sp.]